MIRATSNVLTTPTIKNLLQLIFPPIHTYSVQYQNSFCTTIHRKFTINIAIHCISHILYEIYLQWARAVHIVHCCTVAVTLCTVALLQYIVYCCTVAVHCVLLYCCAGSGGLIPVIPFRVLPHLAIFTTCPKIVHRTSSPLMIH